MKSKFLLGFGIWTLGFVISGCVAMQKDVTRDVSRLERNVEESHALITEKGEDWQKKYASLSEDIIALREKTAKNEGAIGTLLVRIENSDEKAENFRIQTSQELVSFQKSFSSQMEDLSSRIKEIQKAAEENSKKISEASLSLEKANNLNKTLNEKYEEKLNIVLDEIKEENKRLIKEIEKVKKRFDSQFHIVKKGETISSIANLYNVSSKEILKVNHISDPNKISIGQKLIIPGGKDG